MMTSHELSRIRRQAHRRLRVVMAQRRLTATYHRDPPPGGTPTRPDDPLAEPAPEH